ncbi:hypothetical protein GOB93_03200 [Acetobacter musti]|uniref:Secreted protein n=1 Tax=Acetobacter musti TaxID=864732 RepID=A0ABX0JMD9_9PROT|nr:hypothetical protein [Acetobacter musti]NHN83646.1 hypothetical protein [Acetobacter musti]
MKESCIFFIASAAAGVLIITVVRCRVVIAQAWMSREVIVIRRRIARLERIERRVDRWLHTSDNSPEG